MHKTHAVTNQIFVFLSSSVFQIDIPSIRWKVGRWLMVTFRYPLNINLKEIRYFVSFYRERRYTGSQIVDFIVKKTSVISSSKILVG